MTVSHPWSDMKRAHARADPPDPMIRALPPSMSMPALSRAVPMPTMSVLLPTSLPPSLVTVFTAPIASASGSTLSRWSMMLCLWGMVTFSPRMPYPRTTSSMPSRSSVSNGRYTPLIPAAANAAECMAGDLLFDRGLPMIPVTVHPSPRASISSAPSCPGAVGSPTYPNVNSLPRISERTRVTVPSGLMPSRTCLPGIEPDASSMLTRSRGRFTMNAPFVMSQSIPFRMDAMLSADGVRS